jgi:hypothetical protein
MSKSRIASAVVVLTLGFILGLAINTLVGSLSNRASAITETSSEAQGTKRAWEYRVLGPPSHWSEDELETELNKLGREGFEVCGMTTTPHRTVLVVLRRPGR